MKVVVVVVDVGSTKKPCCKSSNFLLILKQKNQEICINSHDTNLHIHQAYKLPVHDSTIWGGEMDRCLALHPALHWKLFRENAKTPKTKVASVPVLFAYF